MTTMLMLAEVSPMPVLISMLKEFCGEYERNPSDQNLEKVLAITHIVAAKEAMKQSGGFSNFVKEMEERKRAAEFFNLKKN